MCGGCVEPDLAHEGHVQVPILPAALRVPVPMREPIPMLLLHHLRRGLYRPATGLEDLRLGALLPGSMVRVGAGHCDARP